MAFKVYIPQDVDAEGKQYLLDRGYEIVMGTALDQETLAREIADCDALFLRTVLCGKNLMEKAPKLKVISRFGIGLDNVDLNAAKDLGIYVLNTPLANITSVAEHTIALMVACAKNFRSGDHGIRQGRFQEERLGNIGFDLAGKTLGLLGFGRIAREVARKAVLGFDMKVIAFDPFCPPGSLPDGVELVNDRDTIFSQSDFVSTHTPVTDETRESIGSREFSMMKKSAYFINCSRGMLMKEKDVYEALRERIIAGAALDVFNQEPPEKDNPLFQLENLIMTPHNAGLTVESSIRMGLDAARGIDDVLSGRRPLSPVVSPVT